MLNDEQVVVVWTHQTKIEIHKLYNLEKIDKRKPFWFFQYLLIRCGRLKIAVHPVISCGSSV
jgi:hypothetical protein